MAKQNTPKAGKKVGAKAEKAKEKKVEAEEEVEEVEEEEEIEEEEETEENDKAKNSAEEEDESEEDSDEDEEESEDDEEESDSKAEKAGESVDIIRNDREYVRTYSKKVHGKNFRSFAEDLVTGYPKRDYKIIPSSEVEEVEVRYREKEDAEKSIDEQKNDSPMVDKSRRFTNKQQALSFNNLKKGSIICRFSAKHSKEVEKAAKKKAA